MQLTVTTLRDQIASPARTILIVLLAAAAVVFVIACSNVANLILARSVRREGELAVRAALGASTGALRRTLLAESLVLCGAGAVLGVLLAKPFVAAVSRYAARFSIRALDVTVDPSVLWIAAGLAMAAAVLLAYVPAPAVGRTRRPASASRAAACESRRAPTAGSRLRHDPDRVLVRAARGRRDAADDTRLASAASTGYDTRQVLVFDMPTSATGVGMGDAKVLAFYDEATRRIGMLPGVEAVAIGSFVPWRDAGGLHPGLQFTVEGYKPADGEESPRGRIPPGRIAPRRLERQHLDQVPAG